MPDAAQALLALWNDVDPAVAAAYEAWHAQEHVPERLTVPGIVWARRFGRRHGPLAPHYLTLYGLRDAAVLDSAPYQRLLAQPTPASRQMRPRLQNLSRWVCGLQTWADMHLGDQLALWAAARDAEAAQALLGDWRRQAGRLGQGLARQLPQAAALPWLAAGQGTPITGDWLVCGTAQAAAGPDRLPPGATVYTALPIG